MYIDLSSPCSGTPFRQRGTDGGAGGRPVALLSSSATPCDMSRSVVSLLVHQSDNVNVTSSVNASRASDTVDGDVVSPPVPTASKYAIDPCCAAFSVSDYFAYKAPNGWWRPHGAQ